MTETTDVEMNVICAYCGKLKSNCTCGCTVGDTFQMIVYENKNDQNG